MALLWVVLSHGCRPEQGTLYLCSCTYVTDFDDDAKRDVEVCAPSDARAEAFGRGCAQTHAPGPITACSCARAERHAPCEGGACRVSPGPP